MQSVIPDPEWAALMQQLADARTEAERQAIHAQLDVITDRRAAEKDAQTFSGSGASCRRAPRPTGCPRSPGGCAASRQFRTRG